MFILKRKISNKFRNVYLEKEMPAQWMSRLKFMIKDQ